MVWTNGVFDVLHIGHLESLRAARGFGDVLIVGVNDDASVRASKGPDRPIFPVADRVALLAALEIVDALVVFGEATPIAPVSPYGVAKAAAHAVVRLTREEMGARATNLVFYLGESVRRAETFVVRKITRGLARVKLGRAEHVTLGNTAVIRDFCYADDLARAAEMFALGATPGDYVVASGEGHTIAEVAHTCCEVLGLDPAQVLRTDAALFRRADIARLVGDASRLRALGWAPSLSFRDLVRTITEHDLAEARREET